MFFAKVIPGKIICSTWEYFIYVALQIFLMSYFISWVMGINIPISSLKLNRMWMLNQPKKIEKDAHGTI